MAQRKRRARTNSQKLDEIGQAFAELRTALYGINGAGGFVREVAGKLEGLAREVERLRQFRHDHGSHTSVLLNRLNEFNVRLAQVANAAPFKPLDVRFDEKDRGRFQIVEKP